MASEVPNDDRRSRASPLPVVLIVGLAPLIAALIGFSWASLEICLDPESFGGDVDTWSEAIQVDADYVRLFVVAFFVFGLIAGATAAACFSIWRLAGCCDPAKSTHDS